VTRLAAQVVDALVARGLLVAVAESLTGGLVQASLVDVPGASRTLRGGVVAYAPEVKEELLGVDGGLLAHRGAVDPEVALEMARGVAALVHADLGLATTGVAGPGPQDGHPPGTVFVAAVLGAHEEVRGLELAGDRGQVRAAARDAALELALAVVTARTGPGGTSAVGGALGQV